MAEPATPLRANNWFALASSVFLDQASSHSEGIGVLWKFDHRANPWRTNEIARKQTVEVNYLYTGSNLAVDLGPLATALRQANGWQIEEISLSFSAFGFPSVNIVGHRHVGTNSHDDVRFNWSSAIPNPSAGGNGTVGIPSGNYKLVSNLPDATITDMVVTAAPTHLDILDHTGRQRFGANVNCPVTASVSGFGNLQKILDEMGGSWIPQQKLIGESNSSHDTWTMELETYFPRSGN